VKRATRARTLLAALPLLFSPDPAKAQVALTGYALGVSSHATESDLSPAGTALLGRARLMGLARSGSFTLDVAYEHVIQRRPEGGGFSVTSPAAGTGGGDWLGTDWELQGWSRGQWRHRFDRLSVGISEGAVEVEIGRQAISWATTLFLTPADPFAPFDPSDPFREYRGGVDAVRIRVFPGPFTEVEAVVRVAETVLGTTITALARAQTSSGGWAVGGWAGVLHDEPAMALFATGAIGATAVRSEASLREDDAGEMTVRATLGLDRFFTPGRKDLYLIAELQYDGLGAPDASHLLEVASSKSFLRGELQTLGSWSAVMQASYQIHALIGLSAMALVNLTDGSTLLAPGLSWSATGSTSVRLGIYSGLGQAGLEPLGTLASEYGSIPGLAYVAVSRFF
jgi:hypothetical protein